MSRAVSTGASVFSILGQIVCEGRRHRELGESGMQIMGVAVVGAIWNWAETSGRISMQKEANERSEFLRERGGVDGWAKFTLRFDSLN